MVDSRTPRSDGCGAPGAGARTTRSADTPISAFCAPRDELARRRWRARKGVRRAGRTPPTNARGAALLRVGRGTPSPRVGSSVSRGVRRALFFHRLARKKITATRKIARIILTRASRANDARRFEPRARASRRFQTRTRALPSCAPRRRRASRARRPVARRIPALLLLRSLWMRRRLPRRPLPRA